MHPTPHASGSGSVFMCAQGVWTFGFRKWCFIAGLTLALKSKSILNITIRRPVQTHTVIHTTHAQKCLCSRRSRPGKKRGGSRLGERVEKCDKETGRGGEGKTGAKKWKVKPYGRPPTEPHRMWACPLPPLISSPTLSHPTSQPPDLPPDSIE